jgi:TonB-linked SusC/RagA family outer membrane protein
MRNYTSNRVLEKVCALNVLAKMLLFVIALMTTISVSAQSWVLKGKVTDKNNQPIPGVTIAIGNGSAGTVTDFEGNYRIDTRSATSTIHVSCVGFQEQIIGVQNRHVIDIVLVDAQVEVDEVVVVGYGQVKKSDLTGSVSSVSKSAMSERVITSLEDALKGQAAGVQIVQNDGTPGSEYSIRIRGASSVNASSQPIYVIDGMISEDALDLNPGDIESLEIMKDASSTAIYGSRGANGVIIITTKKGKEGKPQIEFYSNVGVQSIANSYDMLNSSEYAQLRFLTSLQYAGSSPTMDSNHIYFTDQDNMYWSITNDNPYLNWQGYSHPDTTNTDWQKAMFRDALFQEYRLNITGGTKASRYSVMGSYMNNEGIVVFSGHKKYTGRFNFDSELTRKLSLSTNINVSHANYDGLATGTSDGVTTSMLRQIPLNPLSQNDLDESVDETQIEVSSNPWYQAKSITKDRIRKSLNIRGVLDYKLSPSILFRITGTYATENNENVTYYPSDVAQGVKQNGRAIWNVSSSVKLMNEDLVYWTPKLSDNHKLKVMAGFTVEKYTGRFLTAENQNFIIENLGGNSIGQGTSPIIPSSSVDNNPYQMASFLGRGEYNYNDRYLFTATMRADGSSRFGSQHKWGYFPSVSLAWRINEEKFIKQLDVFDNFKLRISAGQSGNTAIPAFQTLSTLSTAFVPIDGEKVSYGVALDRPSNENLKWETTTQYDAGLDLAFFDNQLSLTFDVYRKETKDLLLRRNAPYYTGYSSAWDNIGSIQNEGMELTLNAQLVKTQKFSLSADFNIGLNRSKVLSVPGGEMYFDAGVLSGSGNFVVIREGSRLGQWYGYEVEGTYHSQAEIDALPGDYKCFSITKTGLRPGDHKFVDQDDNHLIDSNDRTVIGNGEPDFQGGFGFKIAYGNLEVNTLFQYSYGADVFNANLATLEAGRDMYNQTGRFFHKGWKPTLYNASGEKVMEGNATGNYRMPGGVAENYCLSQFIEDGSFLRLSNVTLSYNFPRQLVNRLHLNKIRIFVTGNNLYCWTNYYGFDPEVNTKQGNLGDFMPSLDYGSYPRARSFSAGLNVIF